MAPSTKPQILPVYSCDSHWHFEPHFYEWPAPIRKPWYMKTECLGRGKYQVRQGGIYLRNSSSNGTFSINYQLESEFYSLIDERGQVQRCNGRSGIFEDMLWREEDLSLTPWGLAGSIPLPTYGAVNWAAYSTGYEMKYPQTLLDKRMHMKG